MALTPEEKQKIYLEEKARMEAKEKIRQEKESARKHSEEEQRRIYLEEKARLEAKQRIILEKEEQERRKREDENKVYLAEKARLGAQEKLREEQSASRKKTGKVIFYVFFSVFLVVLLAAVALKMTGHFDRWFSPPQVPASGEATGPRPVGSIEVRGMVIQKGDHADEVFQVLKPEDVVGQESRDNPTIPMGAIITKRYHIEGKQFQITLRQEEVEGPYLVQEIILDY